MMCFGLISCVRSYWETITGLCVPMRLPIRNTWVILSSDSQHVCMWRWQSWNSLLRHGLLLPLGRQPDHLISQGLGFAVLENIQSNWAGVCLCRVLVWGVGVTVEVCVCSEPKTSKCGGGDEGGWLSGRGSRAAAAASFNAYRLPQVSNA